MLRERNNRETVENLARGLGYEMTVHRETFRE